jgi:hypothetical protein
MPLIDLPLWQTKGACGLLTARKRVRQAATACRGAVSPRAIRWAPTVDPFAVRAALPYVAIQVPHWEVHVDCGHRHCYVSNAAGGFDIIYHARPVSRIPILDGTNFRTSRAARPPGLWAVK